MTYRLQLLGRFELVSPDGEAIAITSKKSQALMAVVALADGAPVLRSRLSTLLWADRGEEQARNSLRQAFTALRRSIDGHGNFPLNVTEHDAAIDLDLMTVDVQQLSDAVAHGTLGIKFRFGEVLEGMDLAGEEAQHWLLSERQRVSTLYCDLQARRIEQLCHEGDLAAAQRAAQALLAVDPLDERAHRAIMQAHAAHGEPHKALKQYQACVDKLEAELGISPGAETAALAAKIRAGTDIAEDVPEPTAAQAPANTAPLAIPDKPSLVVLPFANLSDDPEQEYFADGITEDIITELSRFRSLFVIARNSSFHFKGQSPKVQDVGRDLGVQYVVEGSVRKSGIRVRISAQLVEAATGNHIWAERYDRELQDIFAVQDEVASEIVTAVPGHVDMDNRAQAAHKPTADLNAYDLVLRAEALIYQDWISLEIQRLLEEAIKLDPRYARAHARLANFLAYSIFAHHADIETTFALARKHADIALDLNSTDPVVHALSADAYVVIGDPETARRYCEKAIALNPNDFAVMVHAGLVFCYLGDTEEGLKWAQLASRRDPYGADAIREGYFDTYYMAGRYEEAIEQTHGWRNPPPHIYAELAAAYAMLDRMDEAYAAAARYRESDPEAWEKVELRHAHCRMCALPEDAERWREGYCKAGIPI